VDVNLLNTVLFGKTLEEAVADPCNLLSRAFAFRASVYKYYMI
jgi:hypothetical protein